MMKTLFLYGSLIFYAVLFILLLHSALAVADTRVALVVHDELGPERRRLSHSVLQTMNQEFGREKRLALVDDQRIEAALDQLALERRDLLDSERAAQLGQSLQAEVVVAAQLRVGAYRISGRIIDVHAQRGLGEEAVSGGEQQIFDLVDVLGARLASKLEGGTHATVAVLPFANRAEQEYQLFVRGLADLLSNSLGMAGAISTAERKDIDKGLAALAQGRQLSEADAIELGKFLGVDVVIMGEFSEVLHVEMRAVESKSARVLGEELYEAPMGEVDARAGELSAVLAKRIAVAYKDVRKVAVLYFQNHAGSEHDLFVQGIADMLMTSLGQLETLQLIERVQVERAVANFNIELSGVIDAATAVEVGTWLGADAVVLGSFTRFGALYRIDARLIDAETGELIVAQNARGNEVQVMALVDQLGTRLGEQLNQRSGESSEGTGTLAVHFNIKKSEMGERPVYFHICKIYVDGQYMGLSPVVEELDREVVLFSKSLRAGQHQVSLVHGFVKEGRWDGEMPDQPRIFNVLVEPDGATALRYEYEVGWFEDKYNYPRQKTR